MNNVFGFEKECISPESYYRKLSRVSSGVKLDGKSIWKIHLDFVFENPFFLNLF